jgi:hypothetical protein
MQTGFVAAGEAYAELGFSGRAPIGMFADYLRLATRVVDHGNHPNAARHGNNPRVRGLRHTGLAVTTTFAW